MYVYVHIILMMIMLTYICICVIVGHEQGTVFDIELLVTSRQQTPAMTQVDTFDAMERIAQVRLYVYVCTYMISHSFII
jgi:hypothetical protein